MPPNLFLVEANRSPLSVVVANLIRSAVGCFYSGLFSTNRADLCRQAHFKISPPPSPQPTASASIIAIPNDERFSNG
jgi:hypothetical protein